MGACLKQRRVDFIIVEKEHQVGSSWRRHYERLHLHTIKSRSSLPFRSFDRNYPRYVPRALVVRYLEEYAASFDLKPHFGENVHAVRKQGNEWLIESTSKAFSAPNLVVASGLNAEPVTPHYPGAEKFRGHILLGGAYVNATPFKGQRVLVVGMGNTGAEIALDLCEHGAETTISIRGGVHIVPRDLFGLPIQVVATVATYFLPLKINDALFPVILDFALGNLAKHGIKRPRQGILEQVVKSGENSSLRCWNSETNSRRTNQRHAGHSCNFGGGRHFRRRRAAPFRCDHFATGYCSGYQNFLRLDDSPEHRASIPPYIL